MKFFNHGKTATLLFALVFSQNLFAQKSNLEVNRCSGASKTLPVRNIHVDAENAKWVASGRALSQVRACDFGTPTPLAAGENSALLFPGGNADVRWTHEALVAQVKAEVTVSAAFYDAAKDILWLGTKEAGLLQLKTKPALTLTDKFNTVNSKLRSNEINTIFQDKTGRLWVGARDGLMTGGPGKWKSELQGFDVQRIREFGADVYALADGEFWLVERGEKFKAFAIPDNAVESDPIDFDIDPDGKLWMLSAIVTRLDLLTDEFVTFSGPENYTSLFGRCIAVDQDGAVWIGTDDKGLYVIDKSSSLTVNILTEKELACAGNGRDASLRVKISGGKAPFTYDWSAAGLSGEAPQNLGPGAYSVTVTDAAGKTKSAKITLADPKVTLSAEFKQAESGPGKADGQAEAKAAGGSGDFSYKWDNGETSALAKKLTEGRHGVTVTDSKGCTASASATVTQKAATLVVALAETGKIKCNNATTSLKATVSGGKTPYQYAWSNPAFKGDQPANVQRGDYQLTVTDAAGTTASAAIKVSDPELLTVSVTVQTPASTGNADGKALAQVKGGTQPYAFQWDNGETAAAASKLPPGERSLKVTDANGCNAGFVFKITENILPLNVSIEEAGRIKCAGEKTALKASVSGGKTPFKYAWNNPALIGENPASVAAGNFQLTVTDAAGSTATASFSLKEPAALTAAAQAQKPASTGNADGKATASGQGGSGNFTFKWDNGETTAAATKLAPGAHTVTIADANGCSAEASVTIPENILPLSVSIEEVGKIKCAGDKTSLKVEISGGKGPFQFAWNNPALNGETPSGVAAGDYIVSVTDAAGSQTAAKFTVVQPAPFNVIATVQAPASTGNADGRAIAQPRGGAGANTFAWDNGETGAEAKKLAPGRHSVTATDANGCTVSASVEISENILPLTLALEVVGQIKCAGETVGLKTVVSGGKGPFQYRWSDPVLGGDNPTRVPAGDYQLTVTDASGASQTTSIGIKAPAAMQIEVVRTVGATTDRSNDGRASVKAAGGSGAPSFAWDNGETAAEAKKLGLGQHTVTATDAKGCTATATVETKLRILPALTMSQLQNGQTIRMEQLRFEADSASLNDDCLPVLNELYDFLAENGGVVIEIGGHTNSTPPDEFCDRLSSARAKSVADYLIGKGIAQQRVAYKGYGKRKPVATNATPEGRRMNQRVEIKILRIDDRG